MIHEHPSDDVLQAADIVTLVDAERGWHLTIAPLARQRGYDTLRIVHIPVKRDDAAAIQSWRDHVAAVRTYQLAPIGPHGS